MKARIFVLFVTVVFAGCAWHQPSPEIAVKSKAYAWLCRAREEADQGNIGPYISFMQENLEREGLTLKKIGTSEEEIASLILKSNFADAKYYLSRVRSEASNGSVEIDYDYLHRLLQESGYTLADVGTDIAEMQTLLKAGFINQAKIWLTFARKKAVQGEGVLTDLDFMRENLAEADLSLEDIGTNETEISELARKSHFVSAQYFLKSMRDESDRGSVLSYRQGMEEHLQEGGYTLADIGTTEAEVYALQRDGFIAQAKKVLEGIRQKSTPEEISTFEIERLINYIHWSEATFQEIGTDAAEMRYLGSLRLKRICPQMFQ